MDYCFEGMKLALTVAILYFGPEVTTFGLESGAGGGGGGGGNLRKHFLKKRGGGGV